jgi:hypothetical protein
MLDQETTLKAELKNLFEEVNYRKFKSDELVIEKLELIERKQKQLYKLQVGQNMDPTYLPNQWMQEADELRAKCPADTAGIIVNISACVVRRHCASVLADSFSWKNRRKWKKAREITKK